MNLVEPAGGGDQKKIAASDEGDKEPCWLICGVAEELSTYSYAHSN